jgi:hypothetical protein
MARQAAFQRSTRYVGLARGVKKRWMARGAIVIYGKSYTPQEILDELQSFLDAAAATLHAHGVWREQVAKQRALEAAGRSFVGFLGVAVRTEYGESATALEDFGLEPAKKTGPKTVQAKVVAAVKGKATRVRRGTMGKRQRKKVKAG